MFSRRIGNMEARLSDSTIIQKGKKIWTIEIVKWWDETFKKCHVIALFEPPQKEDQPWDLRFVGDRPFDTSISRSDFMLLAEESYRLLEATQRGWRWSQE